MYEPIAAALIGFAAGLLSGAFGLGGGVITTPGLRLILHVPALVAVGTPLPVIIPSALTGAISYTRAGMTDIRAGLVIGFSGALTAVAGAFGAERVGGTFVLVATGVVVIWAAGDMVLQALMPPRWMRDASAPEARTSALALAGIGLTTGLYSGFLGLGGGFILVPMLTRWMRFPIKRAIGTSLIAVATLAVPGSITHALLGNVDWGLTVAMIVGVVPGAWIGARLTQRAGEQSVRIAFAVLLAFVGVYLIVSELGLF